MRLRTGLTPTDWRDMGPAVATGALARYSALPIGTMVPVLREGPVPVTANEMRRRQIRRAAERERTAAARTAREPAAASPRCGVWMPRVSANCGRRPDHKRNHASPRAVRADNAHRATVRA